VPETQPKHAGGLGRAALAWLAAYAAFRLLTGVAQLPTEAPAALIAGANGVAAAASIGLPIGALAALAAAGLRLPALLQLGGLSLAAWIALAAAPAPGLGGVVSATLQDVGKIVGMGSLGLALAAGIREPHILFPAGLFAAFADFVVVRFGTVRRALSTEQGRAVVQAVSAQVPAVHASLSPLTIGPADFLFLGVFLGCAARFEMGLTRTALVLAAVLAISLLLVPVLGAVPALAPMALAFLAVNHRAFRLSREEAWGTLVVLLAAGGLFFAYFRFG
jgi:hypothetical protein